MKRVSYILNNGSFLQGVKVLAIGSTEYKGISRVHYVKPKNEGLKYHHSALVVKKDINLV